MLLQLQGKTDQRFVEGAFRYLRDNLNVRTVLSPAQFLEPVSRSTSLWTGVARPRPQCAAAWWPRPGHVAAAGSVRRVRVWYLQVSGPRGGVDHPPPFAPDLTGRTACVYVQGFAERKVLLVCDAIQACKKIHNDEVRKERLAALRPGKQVGCATLRGCSTCGAVHGGP